MTHGSEEIEESVLYDKLKNAQFDIKFGGTYRHYKHRTRHYVVQGFAIIESTGTVGVIYQAQYGKMLTFVRPLSSFNGEVDVDGKKVRRFKPIKD